MKTVRVGNVYILEKGKKVKPLLPNKKSTFIIIQVSKVSVNLKVIYLQ